jgi:hypothetical protein
MASTYAIIYSTATKAIRRVISDDHGNVTSPNAVTVRTSTGTHTINSGESVIIATNPSAISPHQYSNWAAAVQAQIGVTPPLHQVCCVDGTNTVQTIIMGDAALDSVPGFTMIDSYSPQIVVGCTWDPVGQLFSTPGYTLPPLTKANPTAVAVVVAAAVISRP